MRLTARGKAFALAALALWAAAFALRSARAALAACLLSGYLLVYLAALDLPPVEVQRAFDREQAFEEDPVRETLRVAHAGRRHRRVTLREAQPPGLSADKAEIEIELQPRHASVHEIAWATRTWGAKRFGALRVVASDPLHLLEIEGLVPGEAEVRVLPRGAALDKYGVAASNPEPALGSHNVSRPGDGSEFFTLREYQPGDSVRRINWKASARSPKLMVNQVTRDTYARVVLFLDMREKEGVGAHERSPFVRSVRAAAQILASHDRLKDHAMVVRVTDEAARTTLGANPSLLDQLQALAGSQPQGSMSLAAATRESLPLIHPRSPVYVLTSGALDADLQQAIHFIRATGAWPIVVSPALPPIEDDDDGAFERSRARALDAARAAGARVHDWKEGESLAVILRAA